MEELGKKTVTAGTLTKADLVDAVYERLGFSKKEAQALVESFFELIKKEILQGRDVKLSGFGVFSVKRKAPRRGRNPKTGEDMLLPGRLVVTFRPSRILRDAMNGKDIPEFLLEEDFVRGDS
jgi:integration host factor subunit alpha